MRLPPPTLTRSEIDARATEKRQRVLNFLASGEVFTSARIAASLVNIGLRNSQRLLCSMTRDDLLAAEKIDVLGGRIYGITPRGIALSSQDDPGPHFESGRVGALHIAHHLDCQAARLAGEAAGWCNWIPDRRLAARGFKKIPDAISTAPWGAKFALEIERTIKTPKRYAEIIAAHLLQIKTGYYTHVIYISPRGESRAILRALHRVETVRVNGEPRRLTDAHFARFVFVDLDEFPRAVMLNTSLPRAAVGVHP